MGGLSKGVIVEKFNTIMHFLLLYTAHNNIQKCVVYHVLCNVFSKQLNISNRIE